MLFPAPALLPSQLVWEAHPVAGSVVILAHQGGWDEALLAVGLPLTILGGLLWAANARADRLEADDTDDGDARDQARGCQDPAITDDAPDPDSAPDD